MTALVIALLILLIVREYTHYQERKVLLKAFLAKSPKEIDKPPAPKVRAQNAIRRNIKEHESRVKGQY